MGDGWGRYYPAGWPEGKAPGENMNDSEVVAGATDSASSDNTEKPKNQMAMAPILTL